MRNPFACTIVACMAGCAVGPDYQRPTTAVTGQFTNGAAASFTADEVQKEFWTVFGEPTLNELVQAALLENKDLERARANLRASRAARRLVGFDAGAVCNTEHDAAVASPAADQRDRQSGSAVAPPSRYSRG